MWGCTFSPLAGWNVLPGVIGSIILLPIVVYFLLRNAHSKRRNVDRKDSLAILRKRLAAGEISLEEFVTLKQHL